MKRAALYARVSATGATIENQVYDLEQAAQCLGWEVVETFVDEGRKGREEWPALERLMNAVIREEIDVIAAWSVGQLGRSLQDLLALLEKLRSREVDLYLHVQGLHTGAPSGKLIYQMLELCAAFECAIIAEWVGAGLARARAQGRRLGRPEVDPFLIEDMRSLRAEGHSLRFIADRLGVGRGTVEKYTKGKSRAA
jgi:DNA invertase Pin-like site-specific DNA recombinase